VKKNLPNDYGLTQEDIEWCNTREKEIEELSYKKFLPKIWIGLFVVGVVIYILVLIINPSALKCSQFPSCLSGEEILMRFFGMFAFGAMLYYPALIFAAIVKQVYVISAKQDGRLKNYERYKQAIARYNAISDEDIVSDYADFIHEHYELDIIWDVSKLPHPKERIMDALIKLNVKETTSDEKKKAIAVIFIYLSQFQEGVGGKDLRMSRMEEISKLVEDNESGKINLTQYQSLMTEVIDGAEKEKLAYDKFNILVMKDMNETLPKKLIEGIARALTNK
jgi:hypothetical protein